MTLMLWAYRNVTGALEPWVPKVLERRAARGKEDLGRINERMGRAMAPRPRGPLIWLHGASVGESLSLLPLVEALTIRRPDLGILVTSGTVTAAELLSRRLPPRAIHQYVPVDAPHVAAQFLDHWQPGAAIFAESELWPNLLMAAEDRDIRLALLGARISAESARGWSHARGAARRLFAAFDLILAQDAMSRARFESLGAVVDGELDLKQTAAPLPCNDHELARLKAEIGGRPVLVAASTHPGEDERIARAFQAANLPDALLILVPRHPDRAPHIAHALQGLGLSVARRMAGEHFTPAIQVYLADTLGELGLFFRLAQAVVMGGSLMGGVGGHNPLEPARLHLPVITGADVTNFRESYAGLIAAGAAVMASDQAALNAAVAALMADPSRAKAMGDLAFQEADQGQETLARALAALEPLLPAPPP
jgi:3-deoxy-D-manno-octulosonic-acid transferase